VLLPLLAVCSAANLAGSERYVESPVQVREELLEVEKRVAEMDGKAEAAVSEYAKLRKVPFIGLITAQPCFAAQSLCPNHAQM
jgi:hypothetical protein